MSESIPTFESPENTSLNMNERPVLLKVLCILKKYLAVWTGLEPATPCVTGRYSNQLNYQTVALMRLQIYTAFFISQLFLTLFLTKIKIK